MTAMTSEREAFEKWSRQIEGLNLCQVDGRYTSTRTRCAWNAWNRRAHLSQPAQAVDVEKVREVAEWLAGNSHWITGAREQADKLTAAIGEGK